MYDPFLENDKDGIPIPPTKEQWAQRDQQLGRKKDAAVLNALKDTNTNSNYYLEYTEGYQYYFVLSEEMDRCFRCGCWLSSICIGSSALDAFFHEAWGISRAEPVEKS
jgi:hypothetical protein